MSGVIPFLLWIQYIAPLLMIHDFLHAVEISSHFRLNNRWIGKWVNWQISKL